MNVLEPDMSIDIEKEPPARFCDHECRESYREERLNNIELPRYSLDHKSVSHKVWCAEKNLCACCLCKLENN